MPIESNPNIPFPSERGDGVDQELDAAAQRLSLDTRCPACPDGSLESADWGIGDYKRLVPYVCGTCGYTRLHLYKTLVG